MPEDLKVSQIGSSPLPPPFRRLHQSKKTLKLSLPVISRNCLLIAKSKTESQDYPDVTLYIMYVTVFVIHTVIDLCVCVCVIYLIKKSPCNSLALNL